MRSIRPILDFPIVFTTGIVLVSMLALDFIGFLRSSQIIAIIWVGFVILRSLISMIRDMVHGHLGLDLLAVVAMISSLAVGEYLAATVIVLMLSGGAALEEFAERRAKRDLTSLLDRSPQTAHVLDSDRSFDLQKTRDLPVDEVVVGDILLVRPSEIVPVDGVLLTDEGTFDESSITGESMPVNRSAGEEVLSGALNGSRAIRMRASRRSVDSQYQQIVRLVHIAEASQAPIVRLADRFALPFTAVALVLAGTAWAISSDPVRFAEVLVLATPCPLLIAAPVAFLGGLSRSARLGVIVKGGAVLEQLARVKSAAFDKTGTLTRGRPSLVSIKTPSGFDADRVLQLAASAEQYSTHVLADGIRQAAIDRGLLLLMTDEASEQATNGVTANLQGQRIIVGKPDFVASFVPDLHRVELLPGQAAAYVAVEGRSAGALVFADDPRPESRSVISWMRANGMKRLAILTGDARETAASIGQEVGIDEIHAELLPAQKVELARQFRPRPMMMIGDGVNDAPVLASADIGIAMGARGATAAGDAADIVILVDSLARVADAVIIGRQTMSIALTAIWIGIGLSFGLMLIAMTGVIPPVAGALIQEVVDLAAVLYALRSLRGSVSSLSVVDVPTA